MPSSDLRPRSTDSDNNNTKLLINIDIHLNGHLHNHFICYEIDFVISIYIQKSW